LTENPDSRQVKVGANGAGRLQVAWLICFGQCGLTHELNRKETMEQLPNANENMTLAGPEIPLLRAMVVTIIEGRWLIVLITCLFVAIGAAATVYLSTYKSEGFFQFGGPIPMPKEKVAELAKPGIALADYKRYAAAFGTAERFNDFVKQNKLENFQGVANLNRLFASRDGISRQIEPVFPFTKLDAKDLMDQPKDAGNNLIGLRISYEGADPQNAQQIVGLLGRYAMDTIIYMIYSDTMRFRHSEINSKITKLENTIIESRERLGELKRQGVTLREIVSKYPASATQGTSQVISVTEDSARYLSPVTHLMSTEVQASETDETIIRSKREQEQNYLYREYYDQVKKLMENTKSGEAILRGLEPIKEAVFKSKNLGDETVKLVYNTITIENQTGMSLYLEKSRFIAGPSLPTHRTSRLSVTVVLSFCLGLLTALLFLFVRQIGLGNMARNPG
jgi:hypothetical protein